VDVYDVDRTEDGRPYVVYEYLDGIELGVHIEQRGQDADRGSARASCSRSAKALAAAHARGVIHRDVKPENVWLTGDLTRAHREGARLRAQQARRRGHRSLTKTGAVIGTPSYMAPEQARGERVDVPTDVYGAGAILYSMLTGKAPFDRGRRCSDADRRAVRGSRAAAHLEPIVPEALELVIQRAMAKEPAQRYPSVEALADALDAFVDRALPSVRPAPSQPPAASASRGLLVAYLVVCFALAFVAATTIAVGIAHAIGGPAALSDRELVLVILALSSTAVTPAVLWIRHLKRTVWQNSVKVQELLRRVRRVTVAAIAAYGLAALAVRAIDTVVARFSDSALVGAAGGPAWVPFNVIFGLVAAFAGALAWLADRYRERARLALAAAVVLIGRDDSPGPGLAERSGHRDEARRGAHEDRRAARGRRRRDRLGRGARGRRRARRGGRSRRRGARGSAVALSARSGGLAGAGARAWAQSEPLRRSGRGPRPALRARPRLRPRSRAPRAGEQGGASGGESRRRPGADGDRRWEAAGSICSTS
jgi:hypothetical protein